MNKKKNQKWKLIIPWLATNYSGIIIGYVLTVSAMMLTGQLDYSIEEEIYSSANITIGEILVTALIFLLQFLSIFIAQWLYIKKRIKKVNLWIPAGLFSYSIIVLVIIFIEYIGSIDLLSYLQLIGLGLLLGLLIAIPQWMILKKSINNSYLWIIFSSMSYFCCNLLIALMSPVVGLFGWGICNIGTGLILNQEVKY